MVNRTSDEEIRLAIAVADRVEQGKERVFTFEESIADIGLGEEGEAPFEDSFVATVNELAVKTQQSKAEVLASALNLYHRFVHDEALRLVIQGEVNSHHTPPQPPDPSDDYDLWAVYD